MRSKNTLNIENIVCIIKSPHINKLFHDAIASQ